MEENKNICEEPLVLKWEGINQEEAKSFVSVMEDYLASSSAEYRTIEYSIVGATEKEIRDYLISREYLEREDSDEDESEGEDIVLNECINCFDKHCDNCLFSGRIPGCD